MNKVINLRFFKTLHHDTIRIWTVGGINQVKQVSDKRYPTTSSREGYRWFSYQARLFKESKTPQIFRKAGKTGGHGWVEMQLMALLKDTSRNTHLSRNPVHHARLAPEK